MTQTSKPAPTVSAWAGRNRRRASAAPRVAAAPRPLSELSSGLAPMPLPPAEAFHGAAVTVTNAKGPFRLDANNAASWQWDEGQLEMGMSFQAIEAF